MGLRERKNTDVQSEVEKLTAIFNSSPDIFILINTEYKIIAYNYSAAYSARLLFGKHLHPDIDVSKFYIENAYQRFESDLHKSFKGITTVREEKLELPKKIIWFQFRLIPVFDDDKKVIATVLHAIEISGFKKDKEALRNERKLFNRGPAVAFKWTPFKENSTTKFVSPNVRNVFGYSASDLMDKHFIDFIHPDDIKGIKQHIETKVAQTVRQGKGFVDSTYRVLCANGTYKWVNDFSFLAEESDGKSLVYGYLIDISEQKKITLELEQKNKQLKEALELAKLQSKIIEVTTNIIIITDENDLITWVNDAFEKTLGYSLKEIIGKHPGEILRGKNTDLKTIEKISKAVENKEIIKAEILNYKKNGEEIWLDIVTEPIYDEQGKLSSYLSIQNDITNRKIIEEELKNRNEQLKKFSFTTSHELRHEFAKILSLLENKEILLQNTGELNILEEINTATATMNEVISKMNEQLYVSNTFKDSTNKQESIANANEILLIDDDDIVCFINKKIISSQLPEKSIEVFNSADEALNYISTTPKGKTRFIFLDINMPIRNGWDFLDEYTIKQETSPVIILSSSIDSAEREKAKNYAQVISFFSKPLTNEKIKSLI